MMKRLLVLAIAAVVAGCTTTPNAPPPAAVVAAPAAVAAPQAAPVPVVLAAWTQLQPGGGAEMRAIVPTSTCPNADIDGQSMPMAVRAPADANFPLLCSMTLPKGAKQITAGGIVLKAPVADPQRILVLGDTGCRIKKDWAQDCSSSTAWPFQGLSKAAADMNPDLVLHLGDFLYRESECPTAIQPGCAGSPHGDNWPTWAADFFSPATPLLEVAPWIVNRGNHEDCSRQG